MSGVRRLEHNGEVRLLTEKQMEKLLDWFDAENVKIKDNGCYYILPKANPICGERWRNLCKGCPFQIFSSHVMGGGCHVFIQEAIEKQSLPEERQIITVERNCIAWSNNPEDDKIARRQLEMVRRAIRKIPVASTREILDYFSRMMQKTLTQKALKRLPVTSKKKILNHFSCSNPQLFEKQ